MHIPAQQCYVCNFHHQVYTWNLSCRCQQRRWQTPPAHTAQWWVQQLTCHNEHMKTWLTCDCPGQDACISLNYCCFSIKISSQSCLSHGFSGQKCWTLWTLKCVSRLLSCEVYYSHGVLNVSSFVFKSRHVFMYQPGNRFRQLFQSSIFVNLVWVLSLFKRPSSL